MCTCRRAEARLLGVFRGQGDSTTRLLCAWLCSMRIAAEKTSGAGVG